MSFGDRELLEHMLEAVDVGLEIAAAGRERFDADPVPRFAADTVISRLAECGGNLREELRETMPEMPWRVVAGMRNRLQHASLGTDYDQVWHVLAGELVSVRAAIVRTLDSI